MTSRPVVAVTSIALVAACTGNAKNPVRSTGVHRATTLRALVHPIAILLPVRAITTRVVRAAFAEDRSRNRIPEHQTRIAASAGHWDKPPSDERHQDSRWANPVTNPPISPAAIRTDTATIVGRKTLTWMKKPRHQDPAARTASITPAAARVTHRGERDQASPPATRVNPRLVRTTTIAAVRTDSAQILGNRTWVSGSTTHMAPTRLALMAPATLRPNAVSVIANSTMTRVTQATTLVIPDRLASIRAATQRRSA